MITFGTHDSPTAADALKVKKEASQINQLETQTSPTVAFHKNHWSYSWFCLNATTTATASFSKANEVSYKALTWWRCMMTALVQYTVGLREAASPTGMTHHGLGSQHLQRTARQLVLHPCDTELYSLVLSYKTQCDKPSMLMADNYKCWFPPYLPLDEQHTDMEEHPAH